MPGIKQLARGLARRGGLDKRPDGEKNIDPRIIIPSLGIEITEFDRV